MTWRFATIMLAVVTVKCDRTHKEGVIIWEEVGEEVGCGDAPNKKKLAITFKRIGMKLHLFPFIFNAFIFRENYSDGSDSSSSVEGEEGHYYGGYGRCFNCQRRGHWAPGCPY